MRGQSCGLYGVNNRAGGSVRDTTAALVIIVRVEHALAIFGDKSIVRPREVEGAVGHVVYCSVGPRV
jgi:hypothetical protein